MEGNPRLISMLLCDEEEQRERRRVPGPASPRRDPTHDREITSNRRQLTRVAEIHGITSSFDP
jgi:hypothetical protein